MLLAIYFPDKDRPLNLQVDNMTSFRVQASTNEMNQIEFLYTFIGESEQSILLPPYEEIHKLDLAIRWSYDAKMTSLVVTPSFGETINELRRQF